MPKVCPKIFLLSSLQRRSAFCLMNGQYECGFLRSNTPQVNNPMPFSCKKKTTKVVQATGKNAAKFYGMVYRKKGKINEKVGLKIK